MTSLLTRTARFFVAPAELDEFAPPRAAPHTERAASRAAAHGEPAMLRAPAYAEPAGPRAVFTPPTPRPAVAGFPAAEPQVAVSTGAAPPLRPAIGVVLAAEADLLVAAGAVAASLRRENGAPAALVCAWRGHDEPPLPAPAPGMPAAARLATKLTRRGLAARACGAVCVVELPAGPEAAVAAFRDGAAAAEVPAILALARRDPMFDAILAGADRLVLALGEDADHALAELALEGLRALGPAAEQVELPRGLVARQAVRLGLAPATVGSPAAALQERLS